MKSKIGVLIGLFSGVLTLVDAFAAQVDVVNDGVHYNNGLHSQEFEYCHM